MQHISNIDRCMNAACVVLVRDNSIWKKWPDEAKDWWVTKSKWCNLK